MKSLVGAALATLALTSLASASVDTPNWLQLDSEIASLNSSLAADGGASVGGFLRSYYDSNSDANVGGWRFEQLRLNFDGRVEDMKWRVSIELGSGTAKLQDAFVKWKLTDLLGITWGQFKRPNLYAFNVGGGHRLMILPTMNVANQKREAGAMLNGNVLDDSGHWFLAAFNGTDGTGDDLHLQARAAYDFLGKGGFLQYEGAVDAPENMAGSVALAYADDQDPLTGGTSVSADAVVTGKRMYFHAEVIDYDKDFMGLDKVLVTVPLANTTTLALTASYLVAEDMEVAVRHEDWDDADNSTRLTLGFNFYQVLQHRAKWSINYTDLTSDDPALEAQVFSAGLTLNL